MSEILKMGGNFPILPFYEYLLPPREEIKVRDREESVIRASDDRIQVGDTVGIPTKSRDPYPHRRSGDRIPYRDEDYQRGNQHDPNMIKYIDDFSDEIDQYA